MISVKAAQKGLDFICDVAPDVPRSIHADGKRLRQVLLNLLSNAVKFTDRGQVTLRVRFTPPAWLRFEVQDTGVGIDANQLDLIFQPFEQAGDAQYRLGGTGLGLAISRQYVRLMGGDIHVQSQLGQGSTFWFELAVPTVEAMTAMPLARTVIGYSGPRKKILVVDDVAENRMVAAGMLKSLGFEVVEATNGREAVELAQSLRPHLILIDSAMPEMDGLEAVRHLRRLAAFKDVPIIAASASVSASDSEKCLEAGVNACLIKPIDMGKLLSQIAMLLPLDWIYDSGTPALSMPAVVEPLVMPPVEELEILYLLARLGNMQEILARTAYLIELDQRYGPFASQLRLLANGYQSKALLSLVERCLPSDSLSRQS
jgi:CheY-like chemotaxis protein